MATARAFMQNVLRPLEEMERDFGVFYRWLSETFADDPEAAMLFYRMSLEEKSHESLVKYLKRLVRQNPNLFGEIQLNLQEVIDLGAFARELVRKTKPPSLEKALDLALTLEASSAEVHYRNAVVYARPELAGLIRSLARGDVEHLTGLQEFAAKRGFKKLLARDLPRFPM